MEPRKFTLGGNNVNIFNRRTFEDETVIVDGGEFTDCQFIRSKLIYHGGKFSFKGSNFLDKKCKYEFGGAAALTIAYLKAIHLDILKQSGKIQIRRIN